LSGSVRFENPVDDSPFRNRLKKTLPARRRWAAKEGVTAYRVYDADIPEFRYAVDVYADHAHVVEYARRGHPRPPAEGEAIARAVAEVLGIPPDHVHRKVKAPKVWGEEQYEKVSGTGRRLVVEEQGLQFWVNLDDYLDTGLFLDHRVTRARVRAEARGKRFLNLFCYTGAFTVHAAAGGAAATTSVDLSNTYLAWARDNLALNGLDDGRHELVRSDVLRWLGQARGRRYDLAVLDPPSYSASKKMERTLDIGRDHVELIEGTLALLAPGGVLYFSTNFRGFELDGAALRSRHRGLSIEETTPGSLPDDIRDRQVHRCFRIVLPGGRE
jgi:23S rRNA (cytosine1962-C5)-methyltransferase